MFKISDKQQRLDGNDLYGFALFQRTKDVGCSTRGYFHQSIVLVTDLYQEISIGSRIGCIYRKLFYDVLSKLSVVLSDLPALENAAGVSSDLSTRSNLNSPTSHTLKGLHHTLEASYSHFLQWEGLGLGWGRHPLSAPTPTPTPAPTPAPTLIVGFDLDMTLVDSSAGITHCMDYVLNKHGITHITKDDMRNTIGIPLKDAFLAWIPDEERCDAIVAEYRALFDEIALPKITLLPGALDALKAVRELGGKILIVSSRVEASIHSILNYTDISDVCDVVTGSLFGEEKGAFLKAQCASVYVGDHTGDVIGAKAADCYSVAVCTGPISKADLITEGADIVFDDLLPFPRWLIQRNIPTTAKEEAEEGELLSLPFLGEVFTFPHPRSMSMSNGIYDGLPEEALALTRVGLLPHITSLWEMLMRGRDIVVFCPSAAVTSSVITAMLAMLTPASTHCCGYDVRPYISTYDMDVHSILTEKYADNNTDKTANSASCIGLSRGCTLARKARLVGISNPYLIRSFEHFHCAIMLPNPDIGHDVCPLFATMSGGKASASAASPKMESKAVTSDELTSSKSSSSYNWTAPLSTAASGLSNMLLFTTSQSRSVLPEYPPDAAATVAFTPLGVAYISSHIVRNHLMEFPNMCYDCDESGKKVYRPVLAPVEPYGTPYVQSGAFPTVLRNVEEYESSESRNSGSNGTGKDKNGASFEKVHDEWVSKKSHNMPVSSAQEVCGTERNKNSHPNHSKHAKVNTSSSSLSKGVSNKCFGLILVRTGPSFNFTVSADKELQSQLDTILGTNSGSANGSVVAIADVLIREHMNYLNAAVMEPFRLLSDITDLAKLHQEHSASADLNAFYGLGLGLGLSHENESIVETDADAPSAAHIEEELELLEGAVAAFQRTSIPPPSRPSSTPCDVPPGIRKVFFDHSNASGSVSKGSKNGGVCSPFILDAAKTRFFQDWMRRKEK